MITVNGKQYPLWSQFVEGKKQWIGGILEDLDGGPKTEITDIELIPNGNDSAMFNVVGKDYSCGFDVGSGGIDGSGEKGWLTFGTTFNHSWRIKENKKAA